MRGVVILFVGIFSNVHVYADSNYHDHQVWEITLDTDEHLYQFETIKDIFELDVWRTATSAGDSAHFRVAPDQIKALKSSLKARGLPTHNVYIPDVQALINDEKSQIKPNGRASADSVATFDYSRYHSPEEVNKWMDLVTTEYGEIVTKEQYGVSYEGRPLYVLKFQKRPSSAPKRVIFVDSLIHCREWITTASLLFIFKEMLTNPAYTHMIDDADWYYAPMVNIDGYAYTWTTDRLWRKTRSTGANSICDGIDANRNWDSYWSITSSDNPCQFDFHGPSANSEPEIRHLANYIMNLGKGSIDAYISTHSYSQFILYAYNYADVLSKDDDILNKTGKMMHDRMKAVHGTYYKWGPGATTLYPFSGTTTDWTYDVAGVVQSYTFELRDQGEYAFILPADQIIPTGEEYLAGLESLSDYLKAISS